MAFKDVLIALTTYPEPTPVSAVDDAVDLAAALGAKASAIACEGAYFVWWNLEVRALMAAAHKR